MIRYTQEARESTINSISELIIKISKIPGNVLNYTDATQTIHYLGELKELIEKESKSN